MIDSDGAIYGRNRRASNRFLWVAVAVCVVAATAFFVRPWRSGNPQHAVPANLSFVLLAVVVLVALFGAIANAYLEGGFVISVLNASATALAFGLATVLSFATGVDGHADAPQVLVFVTFTGISAFGAVLAWGVGNAFRGLKSGSNE